MFIDGTIREYVDKASAGTPTPGGGSVSALAGALGATMACMASNFTIGKKKFKDVEPRVREILQRIESCRESLLTLTEEDSRAYERLSVALALPRNTDEEKAAREVAVQEGVKEAMDVPLRAVRVCRDMLNDLATLADIANPNLISDVGVAAILAEAALRGAELNVAVNLVYLKDAAQTAAVRDELASARTSASERLREVSEKVSRALSAKA